MSSFCKIFLTLSLTVVWGMLYSSDACFEVNSPLTTFSTAILRSSREYACEILLRVGATLKNNFKIISKLFKKISFKLFTFDFKSWLDFRFRLFLFWNSAFLYVISDCRVRNIKFSRCLQGGHVTI